MKFVGNIMRNGQVVVRGLVVNVRFQGKRWSGEISVPQGTTLYAGNYDMALNDGRKGRITINATPATAEDSLVYFDGDGDLK
jgi:hypothetical protein